MHISPWGNFHDRGQAAKATQGVPKSVHKSFGTWGEAIIAFQIALLRGEVVLMNEKLSDDRGEVREERKAYGLGRRQGWEV